MVRASSLFIAWEGSTEAFNPRLFQEVGDLGYFNSFKMVSAAIVPVVQPPSI
jgi:hypothetical protein